MKIMYVVEAYPRLSEIFIAREIYALERLGLDIDVLSLSKPPLSKIRHSLVDKIRGNIIYLSENQIGRIAKGLSHFLQLGLNPARYLRLAKQVHVLQLSSNSTYLFRQLPVFYRIFKSSGAARLHAHFGWTGLVSAWLMSKILGVPYSVTLHGSDVLVSPYPSLGNILRNADHVICVSEAIRRSALDLGVAREKTHVVRCGIDADEFFYDPREWREKPLKILSVGRLHPIKGLSTLVEACSLLHAGGTAFECTVVGDGPEREFLERKIRDSKLEHCFRLAGGVANETLPDIYRAHSVFVLPSLSEGLPVVIMEAMASGLPVVATKVGGVPEIVADGLNGKLVEADRPDRLAEAIQHLHHLSPGEKREMASRNRAKVVNEFNVHKEIAKLLRIFSGGTS